MNWIGMDVRAFVLALVGIAIGSAIYALALTSGIDAPYVVGIFAGLVTMVAGSEKNGIRGVVVGAMALWAAAATQTQYGPFAGTRLLSFHDTLTVVRTIEFAAGSVIAFFLGGAHPSFFERKAAPQKEEASQVKDASELHADKPSNARL